MLRLSDQADGLRGAAAERPSTVRLQRGTSGHTRTLAVTSGKGGVGKTQLSANLAVAMAQRGTKVVLLDADLGLASLDLALGLQPQFDLRSVLEGKKKIDEILIEGPCGVQLLPACPGRYEMANMSASERNSLANAVDEVARRFDLLIIDTGAGIGGNSVSFAASADDVLLITTPDPTSVRDAYAMAKVLHRRSGVEKIFLISNQVSSEAEGLELHERLQTIVKRFLTLKLEYLGFIPRDESVRQATAAGQPYVLRSPSSAATRATESIVRRLGPGASPREFC